MFKNFLAGCSVGAANIIPGVSGGTIMVILGVFDKITKSINNVFNFKEGLFKNKEKDFLFLFQIFLGVGVGLIGFAKILEILFDKFELETLIVFSGLIIFSLPSLIKKELPKGKINWRFLLLGIITIEMILVLLPLDATIINETIPEITFMSLITMVIIGFIAGATSIFPGISGSMILLIIGQYHIFKSLVANVTTFRFSILLQLSYIGLGVIAGFAFSSKIASYLLKNHRVKTMSFIIGLVLMSILAIIPFKDIFTIIGSVKLIVIWFGIFKITKLFTK